MRDLLDHTREQAGVHRGNGNEKKILQGNIAELGNNVYQYRNRNPKNQ
jgi:hypothetical protein